MFTVMVCLGNFGRHVPLGAWRLLPHLRVLANVSWKWEGVKDNISAFVRTF